MTQSRVIAKLPTMAEQFALRKATPKVYGKAGAQKAESSRPSPRQKAIPKAKPEVSAAEQRVRAAVWKRDQAHSRASGVLVVKGHPDEKLRGEVAHLVARSVDRGKKYSITNTVLLTAEEHRLSDRRTAPGGKVLLKIRGSNASKTLTFTRLDPDGRVLWTRQSAPPPPAHKEES